MIFKNMPFVTVFCKKLQIHLVVSYIIFNFEAVFMKHAVSYNMMSRDLSQNCYLDCRIHADMMRSQIF